MAFNHDSFIASASYLALDASLQWYLDTVGPKVALLNKMAKEQPDVLKALYARDPVLQKLSNISDALSRIIAEATSD